MPTFVHDLFAQIAGLTTPSSSGGANTPEGEVDLAFATVKQRMGEKYTNWQLDPENMVADALSKYLFPDRYGASFCWWISHYSMHAIGIYQHAYGCLAVSTQYSTRVIQ